MSYDEQLRHALDMVFRPGYSGAFYMTVLHNENAKANGWPIQRFYPDDPERAVRESSRYYQTGEWTDGAESAKLPPP